MVKRHEIPEDRIMADAVDMFPPDVTVTCECGEWVSLIADGTPAPCPVCGRNVWARIIVQAWVEDSQP